MAEFSGQIVAVTGGSQGIGRALARAFASHGAHVYIFARNAQEVQKTARAISSEGLSCEGRQLDVSDAAAVQAAFDNIISEKKRIDVLVNCAGILGPIGPLEENDVAEWAQTISVNLSGTAFCTRAVLTQMKKQGRGRIIAMAGGGVGGNSIKPNISSYVSSKYAVCGFVEAMSKELEGTGVTINAISPGAINTRMLEQVLLAGEKAGREFLEASRKQKESGGVSPEFTCRLALFLASDRAARISGKALSAVWDKQESLASLMGGEPLYTLKRIDNQLYSEKK